MSNTKLTFNNSVFAFYYFVLGKIEEFNKKSGDSFCELNQNQLEALIKLCDENTIPDEQSVVTLIALLDWPKGK